MSDERCSIYTNCAACENYQTHIFKYNRYPRGVFIPKERCSQNIMYFLLKGEVWVNSDEHPDTILREGQFILQPVGSRVEYRVHTPTESIVYFFDHIQNVCDPRYKINNNYVEGGETNSPTVLNICNPLKAFLDGMKVYLEDDLMCSSFLHAKRSELFFLLNCYYPMKDMTDFYSTVFSYSRSFRYFVLNNYQKVKDVESFAELGGYTVPTFRRVFKETFDEPAYQWMLKQKCQDIKNDLLTSDMSISQVSTKYGFESLANFSHFCKANLGKSPRSLRGE